MRVGIGSFVLRRLGSSLLAVFGVTLVVFLFLHLVPGDPVDQLTGGEATEEQRRVVAECMYLDRPMVEQYTIFLGHIADGTLGRQCPNPETKPSVMDRVLKVLPYTVELAFGGVLVGIFLGVPLGVAAALRRGSKLDALITTVSLSGLSMHVTWIGVVAISVFFDRLGVLPGPAEPDEPFALLLPSVVVGTHLMAMVARMTRSSLVEVLQEDFMTTARAKGLPERTVIFKHGLRNALLPVITVVGLQFGAMLGGAILTEYVFARPGLGTLLLEGIRERNYPVVQGTTLIIAVSYVTVNLLVDLAYGLADPRVRRA